MWQISRRVAEVINALTDRFIQENVKTGTIIKINKNKPNINYIFLDRHKE